MSELTNFFLASTPSTDPRTLTDEDTIEFGAILFFAATPATPAIAVLVPTILE